MIQIRNPWGTGAGWAWKLVADEQQLLHLCRFSGRKWLVDGFY